MAEEKKATTAKKTTAKKDDTSKLQKELDAQKKQNDELRAKLDELMAMLNAASKTDTEAKEDNDDVLVISLMPCKLNLIGEDGGVAYTFEEMYEEQFVPFDELKGIVKKNRKLAKNGRYYIANEQAVKALKLEKDYKSIFSPEQLKKILDIDVHTAIELYKLCPDAQKRVVIECIKQQKFAGKYIDANLLSELGKLAHVDLINAENIFGAR